MRPGDVPILLLTPSVAARALLAWVIALGPPYLTLERTICRDMRGGTAVTTPLPPPLSPSPLRPCLLASCCPACFSAVCLRVDTGIRGPGEINMATPRFANNRCLLLQVRPCCPPSLGACPHRPLTTLHLYPPAPLRLLHAMTFLLHVCIHLSPTHQTLLGHSTHGEGPPSGAPLFSTRPTLHMATPDPALVTSLGVRHSCEVGVQS